MVDFRIRILVDPKNAEAGNKKVGRALDETSGKADRLRSSMLKAFSAIGTVVLLKELGRLADTYTNIQNRLKTVTNGAEELTTATERLFEISRKTRSSFESTAEVYARVGLAAKDLGTSQKELLNFTESLNKAVILSGASAIEAKAGLIQLAQGLASGALRGDELRSVLEQLPVVADVIAKSLKITRGQLRELGAEGKITADIVLKAFREARVELDERFSESTATIGQSFTVLKDAVIKYIGAADEATKTSEKFSNALLAVADNLDLIASIAVGVFATGVAAGLGAVVRKFILLNTVTETVKITTLAGFKSMSKEISVFSFKSAALKIGKFLTNPFVLLAAAVTGATLALTKFNSVLDEVNEASKTVEEGLLTDFGKLGAQILRVQDRVKRLQSDLSKNPESPISLQELEKAEKQLAALLQESDKLKKSYEENQIAQNKSKKAVEEFNTAIEQEIHLLSLDNKERELQKEVYKVLNAFQKESIKLSKTEIESIRERIKANQLLKDQVTVLDKIRGPQNDYINGTLILQKLLSSGKITVEEYRSELNKLSDTFSAPEVGEDPFDTQVKSLEDANTEFRELIMNGPAAAEALRMRQEVEGQGGTVTDTQSGVLRAQSEENRLLQEKVAILNEIEGPEQQMALRQQALKELFDSGRISGEQYTEMLKEMEMASLQASNTMEAGFLRGLERIKTEILDVSGHVEDFLVGTFNAAEDALVDFVKTGELNMDKFRQAIVDMIAQIIVKMLMLYAIQLLTGIPAGALAGGASSTAGRAGGGGVQGNKAFTVGENGPETFVPAGAGTIVPAGETAAMQGQGGGETTVVATPAPAVNVQVVNVTDPSEIPMGMDTEAGHKVIMNALQKNKNAAKGILS